MATAIATCCCYRLHNADTTKSDFNHLGSYSFMTSGSIAGSKPVLLTNNNGRVLLQQFLGDSIPKSGRVNQNRSYCSGYVNRHDRVQAVLLDVESPAKRIDRQRELAEGGTTTTSLSTALSPPTLTPSPNLPKPEMGLSETSLVSTLEHRLWVGFGASAAVGMIAKAVAAAQGSADIGGMALAAVAAYLLADLGTGIYHWGVDNYGDASTPVFGSQIDAFQGHHRRPWTITKREFANNTQAIARPVGFALLPFLVLPTNPAADTFLGVFLGLVLMSQQFHAWAHTRKSQVPAAVNYLQERGILISRKMHGIHHGAPYSINYSIVSGFWNPILNESKFFLRLEAAIYSRWGIAPRNWGDTVASEWVQDGSYFEDGSDIKPDQEV